MPPLDRSKEGYSKSFGCTQQGDFGGGHGISGFDAIHRGDSSMGIKVLVLIFSENDVLRRCDVRVPEATFLRVSGDLLVGSCFCVVESAVLFR